VSVDEVWDALDMLTDPEIPVVTLRELGILREVREGADTAWRWSSRPPTAAARPWADRRRCARGPGPCRHRRAGHHPTGPRLDHRLDERPPRKDKLRAYGIAPPHACDTPALPANSVVRFTRRVAPLAVACPQCGSANTTETSHFGSTACKALYRCLDCLEPFDYFKPY
jgi:ring-1,2-phenylacetyl-CoA epoxidase subunit PaaD